MNHSVHILKTSRVSLVAKWEGICLPAQESPVQSLVQEDSRHLWATKPMPHNYLTCALEPGTCSCRASSHSPWSPSALEPVLRPEKPPPRNEGVARHTAAREKPAQRQGPAQPKIIHKSLKKSHRPIHRSMVNFIVYKLYLSKAFIENVDGVNSNRWKNEYILFARFWKWTKGKYFLKEEEESSSPSFPFLPLPFFPVSPPKIQSCSH